MPNNNLERYHQATGTLIQQIKSATLPADFTYSYDMTETLITMRKLFLDAGLRADTLNPELEQARQEHGMWSAGFCASASYIWNQMFRTKSGNEIWRIECAQYPVSHFWLRNTLDGKILDITFDQFINIDIDEYIEYPYHLGQALPPQRAQAKKQAITLAQHMGIDLNHIVATNAKNSGNTNT